MDYITLALTIVTVINSVLGFVLLINGGTRLSRIYAINVATIIMWAWSMLFFRLSNPEDTVFWAKTLYICASLIASGFLYFSYFFPKTDAGINWKKTLAIFIPNILITLFIILDGIIIQDAFFHPGYENTILFGPFYVVYVAYILYYFLFGFYRLFTKFRRSDDVVEKRQIIYLLTGYALSANIAFFTNLLLPWFGYYELNWFGQISTTLMVVFAAYAIFKHQLFNVKVVATELLTFAIWIFILARILIAETQREQVINGVLLIVLVIFGILLIRSVLREVKTRERIERLAKDLEDANVRLKELDQLKSEFVSIASHQIRAPITAIKGYASLIAEGNFGQLSSEMKEAVGVIVESSNGMAIMVDDFLNISRIEQGKMKYDYTVADLARLVTQAYNELKQTAEKKELAFELEYDHNQTFAAYIDIGKIKQAVTNIIDNSIKYTPKGRVTIGMKKIGTKIDIYVRDTGVGIAPENIGKLFEKFSRARNGISTNVTGTGLGLYVVKQMVEAQKGRAWVESPGEGKGSTFHIELEAANQAQAAKIAAKK